MDLFRERIFSNLNCHHICDHRLKSAEYIEIMKRPSNIIIAFTLAVATAFLAYALGRLFFKAIAPPEIEVEEDYESQLYFPQNNFQRL